MTHAYLQAFDLAKCSSALGKTMGLWYPEAWNMISVLCEVRRPINKLLLLSKTFECSSSSNEFSLCPKITRLRIKKQKKQCVDINFICRCITVIPTSATGHFMDFGMCQSMICDVSSSMYKWNVLFVHNDHDYLLPGQTEGWTAIHPGISTVLKYRYNTPSFFLNFIH